MGHSQRLARLVAQLLVVSAAFLVVLGWEPPSYAAPSPYHHASTPTSGGDPWCTNPGACFVTTIHPGVTDAISVAPAPPPPPVGYGAAFRAKPAHRHRLHGRAAAYLKARVRRPTALRPHPRSGLQYKLGTLPPTPTTHLQRHHKDFLCPTTCTVPFTNSTMFDAEVRVHIPGLGGSSYNASGPPCASPNACQVTTGIPLHPLHADKVRFTWYSLEPGYRARTRVALRH
jgi:hypothetical protein